MFLSDTSIKKPVMTSVVMLVLLLFGTLGYRQLSLNLMPQVDIPFITIQTVYVGASPQQIESLIIDKIEEEIGTLSLIDTITSYSLDSVGVTIVQFKTDKDVDIAYQEVKEKIDSVKSSLPDAAKDPVVSKVDIGASPIVTLTMGGEIDPTELYTLAEDTVKEQISRIAGVGSVSLIGGQEREVRVSFDNKVIYENEISLTQVAGILAYANIEMPGGNFQDEGLDFSVRLKGELNSLEDLSDIEIPTAAGMRNLSQLATIETTSKDVRSRSTYYNLETDYYNDDTILISVLKSPDGNPVQIAEAIEKVLPVIIKSLPEGVMLEISNNDATYIQDTVNDTMTNILIGIALTALILLFFLHDLRSTLIVAITMPLSILPTFMVLNSLGMSLNVMSLMGLSTSVGVLVMNSVVVLENIFRHKEKGNGKKEAAAKGTSEVFVAVLASTLTNVVVFVPIATMGGMMGLFMNEFAWTVVFATLFSLLISFTLTPMLASVILPEQQKKHLKISILIENMFKKLEDGYSLILKKILYSKVRSSFVILLTVVTFVVMLMQFGKIPFEMMPPADQGLISLTAELPQGTNINETADLLRKIESRIKEDERVTKIVTQLGQKSQLETGTNLASMTITYIDKTEREGVFIVADQLTRSLSDLPGVKIGIIPITSTMGDGSSAPISFYLQGEDNDKLAAYSTQLMESMKGVEGISSTDMSLKTGKPEIILTPKRKRMNEMGLSVQDLAMAMRTSIDGMVMTQMKTGAKEYDIRVTQSDTDVSSLADIRNIGVKSPSGFYPLSYFAKVEQAEGYNQIIHSDKVKSIEFTAGTLPGYAVGTVVNNIEIEVDKLNLEPGYKYKTAGMAEMMGDTIQRMAFAFLLAIVLTYLLLAAILEKWIQPLLILSTVPLSLIGVVAIFLITGLAMNMISMLAIVMLVGMVVNNAILILEYTNQLTSEGMGVRKALLTACPTKLRPILMANLSTILGMMPMALGIGASGAEMRQPMGLVSIGGLLAATVLTLFVIPAIENALGSKSNRKRKKEMEMEIVK